MELEPWLVEGLQSGTAQPWPFEKVAGAGMGR